MNAAQRKSVEKAIRDVCKKRGWILKAINVRTNHVHVVVSIGDKKPSDALIALKAKATRQMRETKFGHTNTAFGLTREVNADFGTKIVSGKPATM